MYIIEVINKLLKKHKERSAAQQIKSDEVELYEKCEHLFVPLDSTQQTLACSKCGLVVKKNTLLKKRNFFNK